MGEAFGVPERQSGVTWVAQSAGRANRCTTFGRNVWEARSTSLGILRGVSVGLGGTRTPRSTLMGMG
eukprot:6477027-Amphidinium_carterae.1